VPLSTCGFTDVCARGAGTLYVLGQHSPLSHTSTLYYTALKQLKKLHEPMAHACNPSYWEAEIGRIELRGCLRQIVQEVPSPK
jgi:hypothetical protein